MRKEDLIYVAGHNGMVGSALVRQLKNQNYKNIITVNSSELDLRDSYMVHSFFSEKKPKYVFLAAAKVGGIQANVDFPYTFLMDNLQIQNNVIKCSIKFGVERLLFLGSSCIYPRLANQPLKEEDLMTGKLEPTNEGYAIAKIAGLKAIEYANKEFNKNFLSVMPSNVYGINDDFSEKYSHVLAATIRKIDNAMTNGDNYVEIWGDGTPKREFIYVDDLADACIYLMNNYYDKTFINVGSGHDLTILELHKLVAKITGFIGEFKLDKSKPNGIPRKLLDVTKLQGLGFKLNYSLEEGINKTYQWYLKEIKENL